MTPAAALVPTMGNLHEGHLALVAEARRRGDLVVATIFVNPMQFGPGEDLEAYPRTLAEDQRQLEAAGCHLLFAPETATIYPRGLEAQTRVCVPEVSEGLCGGDRPGHFDGVATVVTMLFHLVQPDVACFGEKDYQQLAVIRRLVADLHLPVEIAGVPIVRAEDGLALSSRNGYLDASQRAIAPALYGQRLVGGHRLRLAPVTTTTRQAVLLTAARLGTTRLIDNLSLTLPR